MPTGSEEMVGMTKALIRYVSVGLALSIGLLMYIRHQAPSLLPTRVLVWFLGALLVGALTAASVLWLRSIRRRRIAKHPRPDVSVLALLFASLVCMGLLILSVGEALLLLGSQLSAALTNPASRIYAFPGLSAAIVLVVGFALFLIRRKYRSTYGAVEVAVGAVVALIQTMEVVTRGQTVDGHFVLVMLTAGVYLVVRGLDNVDVGREKTPKDPTARAVVWAIKQIRSSIAQETSPA